MTIADIISATMLATKKHDDLLPMKDIWYIEIINGEIVFHFVDADTTDYTIDEGGNKVGCPTDKYKLCHNCNTLLYMYYDYCPLCGTKQIS